MALKFLPDLIKIQADLANGDEYAFTVFYNKYHPVIFGFARHLLNCDDLAVDVVQESMLHIWQLGSKLNNINNLEGYLKTIAKRRAVDIIRHRAVQLKAGRLLQAQWKETHNETEEHIILNEGRKILLEGIRLLPPQQRTVYELCQQQGFKYEEAAREMGISAGTVKTHLKLAMRFLRQHISNHTDLTVLFIIFFKIITPF